MRWWALLAAILTFAATAARAAPIRGWEVCAGTGPAGLHDCRPVDPRVLDPQGREVWVRAIVGPRRPNEVAPALLMAGAMSAEAWFNGVRIGSNGQPGPTAAEERPGLYQAEIPIDPALWRADGGNELVLRVSAHHSGLRFAHPIAAIFVGRFDDAAMAGMLALTFTAAGALAAAAFGFGAVWAMRRTGSSLMLAALSGVAALQALAENIRNLVPYPYPLHAWRVSVIWGLAATFAVLLTAYAAARFAPGRRNLLLAVAIPLVAASWLQPGFDQKTGWALVTGVSMAAVAAALGVRGRHPGARPALACLAVFAAVAVISPGWFLDLNFFLLAAALLLPLLVAEVVRVGRDDRARETALTRAASRPDRLTVATAKGVELTPLKDIVAILGADDYAELRLAGGRSLLHDARLEQLAAQLPGSFVRIHRSAIANLAHALRLERDGARWRLHMSEGPPLPVSRPRLAALRDALDPPDVAARTAAQ